MTESHAPVHDAGRFTRCVLRRSCIVLDPVRNITRALLPHCKKLLQTGPPGALQFDKQWASGSNHVGAKGYALRRIHATGHSTGSDKRELPPRGPKAGHFFQRCDERNPPVPEPCRGRILSSPQNPTPAQLVPPAPATSMKRTPASRSFVATEAEMPLPISLTITGTGSVRTSRSIPVNTPRKSGFPSGWRSSCNGFR